MGRQATMGDVFSRLNPMQDYRGGFTDRPMVLLVRLMALLYLKVVLIQSQLKLVYLRKQCRYPLSQQLYQ